MRPQWQRVDLSTFAPDLSPDTPGIFVDSNNVIPTKRGFRTLGSPLQAYGPLNGGPCLMGYFARYLDGSTKLIAGSEETLELGDGAGGWDDASGGTTFTTSILDRWRFAQFGNHTIAVNGVDPPQYIDESATDFDDLPGNPPIARYVAAAGNAVLLANLDPAQGAVDENWIWFSGLGNDGDWDPDASGQSANMPLQDTEGVIVGAHGLGRDFIVYKLRSCYLLQYVGGATIWQSTILSQKSGALSHEAVIDIGGRHLIMGFDDFYALDGSGPPQPIPNPLREFLYDLGGDLDRNYAYAVIGRHDPVTDIAYWHYPSIGYGVRDEAMPVVLDKWVAWHVGTERWSRGSLNIEAAVLPHIGSDPGITYGGFGSLYATWGEPDDVVYTSILFAGSQHLAQGVFLASDQGLYTFDGPVVPEDTFIRTGVFGESGMLRYVTRVRPRFARYPAMIDGTRCRAYSYAKLAGVATQADDQPLEDDTGTFPTRVDGRYVDFEIQLGEDSEIIGVDLEQTMTGDQ